MSIASLPRTLGAAALAAAGLAAGLAAPAAAQAAAMPGDRSVMITFNNHTDLRLSLSDKDIADGDWTKVPPKFIKPLSKVKFGSESSDDQGGTEATVTYDSLYGEVVIYWRNPWTRQNKVTCDAPDELECEVNGDGFAAHIKPVIDLTYAD
ncbi:hypothetical protein Aph02nite_31600 [Actinoplanes philippinensis]|uniref:Uncharacterized protein n=1 Tax=Actinoplanes philippinensis TaxID=35752 RepID=A0A1I2E7X2_9ACTN|nr:hypothetical protein [Actinoplanes philippinensis]GIE77210.1 hypothetical protein Aph02nite_31600 [Actinoplanes philippinensis]SFE88817.1 hypothetical protein SAMN05421541_104245 [Actinoplanes philippinensis]